MVSRAETYNGMQSGPSAVGNGFDKQRSYSNFRKVFGVDSWGGSRMTIDEQVKAYVISPQ